MQRSKIVACEQHVQGYDIPPQDSMQDFKIWAEVEPPKGTVYNYPIRAWHKAITSIAASPAPPDIAVQLYNAGVNTEMLARLKRGASVKDVVGWADDRVQEFTQP